MRLIGKPADRLRFASLMATVILLSSLLAIAQTPQPDPSGDEPQSAPPPERREQLIQQERDRVRADAAGMSSLLAGLDQIEKQERMARRELDSIDRAIVEVGNDIIFTEADRFLTRGLIEREEQTLQRRVRALYTLSRGGLAQILLASEDFFGFVQNARMVNRVVERDVARLRRNREHIRHLAQIRIDLDEDREYLESLKTRAENQRFWVELERQRRIALLELIQSDRGMYARAVSEREQAGYDLIASLESVSRAGRGQTGGLPDGLDFPAARGFLPLPAQGNLVRTFGPQIHPTFGTVTNSNGIGLSAAEGTSVRSVYGGLVRYASTFYGYGRVVILDHGDRYHTVYGHLAEVMVSEGDTVVQGQLIGTVGRSGSLIGPQLHFEIRHKGKSIDPMDWIAWASQEE